MRRFYDKLRILSYICNFIFLTYDTRRPPSRAFAYCSSISLTTCSGARIWPKYPVFRAPLKALGLVLAEQIPTTCFTRASSSRGICMA